MIMLLSAVKGIPWYLWAIAALGFAVVWESYGKDEAKKEVATLRTNLKVSEDGKKIDERSIVTLTTAQAESDATIDAYAQKAKDATQRAAQAAQAAQRAAAGRDALSRALKASPAPMDDVDAPESYKQARGAL